MREIEVLAPAGSFDTMKAAYKAGADAVYMGGPMFGARAYADNADAGQMLSAIDYAHLHGRKLYMTVNTLLKNTEIEGRWKIISGLFMNRDWTRSLYRIWALWK